MGTNSIRSWNPCPRTRRFINNCKPPPLYPKKMKTPPPSVGASSGQYTEVTEDETGTIYGQAETVADNEDKQWEYGTVAYGDE